MVVACSLTLLPDWLGNAGASATGSGVPVDAGYTGINVGGNLVGVTGNSTATGGSVFAVDVNILSIKGTAPTTAGKFDVKGADGDVFVRQDLRLELECHGCARHGH